MNNQETQNGMPVEEKKGLTRRGFLGATAMSGAALVGASALGGA